MIVCGECELLVERERIIAFEDSLRPIVELAVPDQGAEPACRDEVAVIPGERVDCLLYTSPSPRD